jgi:hypothetical protein
MACRIFESLFAADPGIVAIIIFHRRGQAGTMTA